MIDKAKLTETVGRTLANTDAFVVSISVSAANDIVVELDSATGVDLDFCAAVTRAIEAEFDRDVEDYSLEVGSASLTAPFRVMGQWLKHVGDNVEMLTRDGRRLRGRLTGVDEATGAFTVAFTRKVKEPGKKRPVTVEQEERFTPEQVKEIRYDIDFK